MGARPAAKARAFPTALTLDAADVVVVGGGLTGLLTAWGLKTAGRGVVLLDAGRFGAGRSGAASGLTGLLATSDYRALEAMHGRRLARTLLTSVAEAGPSLAAAMKKAKAVVKYEPRPLLSLVDVAGQGLGSRRGRPHRRRSRGQDPGWPCPQPRDLGRGGGGHAAARRRRDRAGARHRRGRGPCRRRARAPRSSDRG